MISDIVESYEVTEDLDHIDGEYVTATAELYSLPHWVNVSVVHE